MSDSPNVRKLLDCALAHTPDCPHSGRAEMKAVQGDAHSPVMDMASDGEFELAGMLCESCLAFKPEGE